MSDELNVTERDKMRVIENFMRGDMRDLALIEGDKQRLNYVAWSVAAIAPGMLALSDKGSPLKVGSVLSNARFVFAFSEVSFVLSIGLAMLIYWLVTKRIELKHASRVERINQATLLFSLQLDGTQVVEPSEIVKLYMESRAFRAKIEEAFGKVATIRFLFGFQQVFLAVGYVALMALVLTQS